MALPVRSPRRELHLRRILAVTAGLIVAGAAAGAVAGALGVSLWLAFTGGEGLQIWLAALQAAALIGAPLGAILLPLAGFTALRRVPLGWLLTIPILGTGLTAALFATYNLGSWLVGALGGFLLSTLVLWGYGRRRPERPATPADDA